MSRQVVMRRRILELLAHPRQIAMATVDLSECPHSGVFRTLDATCRQCAKNHECDWLNSTDEFNGLAEKEMEYLYCALIFGIDFVGGQNGLAKHDGKDCSCASCKWVRDARDTAYEYVQRTI
ncbi:MAG: hypothetical protein IH812_05725 [Proteobacteria bacterium]|nr:hypothetical protein [Pseudomonadota bacterium]